MKTKRIAAIVPIDSLKALEKNLRESGVHRVTVERVQGYGERCAEECGYSGILAVEDFDRLLCVGMHIFHGHAEKPDNGNCA